MRPVGGVLGCDLETEILMALEGAGIDVSLPVLLERLRLKGFKDDSAIKAAIWKLLDRRLIEMTPARNLEISRLPH